MAGSNPATQREGSRGVLMHATPVRGLIGATQSPLFQGRFGRMFRALPPASFGKTEKDNEANLVALANAMKGDEENSEDGPDGEESGIPALYTYLGQFIDHDLTFDPSSSLQKQNDPNALTDFRSPAFDLDSVYGRGPDDQPYMYGPNKELLTGNRPLTGGHPTVVDLPRASNGRAIIGDPRNDENTLVSQLQGLFLRFHNRALQEVGGSFEKAQQFVRFHYQYVVLNDFLPRIVQPAVLDALKDDGRYDKDKLEFYHFRNDPFMPVEFSAAAYRFGHSMVRPGYRLNDSGAGPTSIFPGLTGFGPVADGNAMDWGRFIDVDKRNNDGTDADKKKRLQFAYRMDTSIVEPLANLPPNTAGTGPISLAERNLKRGWRLGLPNGQTVARAMGVDVLKKIMIGKAEDGGDPNAKLITDVNPIFKDNCPLWTYILAEAAEYRVKVKIPVKEDVKITTPKLGPVGGRIVAEVFLGLMFADHGSYLSQDRNWHPASGTNYTLKDFVNYALGN